jgi:hypothetical protein
VGRANPVRNLFAAEIEPSLPIAGELAARAALSELQSRFHLDERVFRRRSRTEPARPTPKTESVSGSGS